MKKESLTYFLLKVSIYISSIGLIFAGPFPLSAQGNERVFSHISIDEGLSANHVKAVMRDRNGFLWIGTTNGLNRYDGSLVKRYSCHDSERNKGNNNIGYLYEDSKGTIWIGTDRGVYYYTPETEIISYADYWDDLAGGALNWVQDIEGDDKGNIWVLIPDQGIFRTSANGVNLYNMPKGSPYNNKEDFYNDICVTPDGTLWACSSNGKIYRYDKGYDEMVEVRFKFPFTDTLKFSRIIPTDASDLILSTEDVKLYLLSPKHNYTASEIDNSLSEGLYFRSMALIKNELWVGTQMGLFSIDLKNGQSKRFTNSPTNPHSISDNTIYALYADNENNLWIGTVFGGVNLLIHDGIDFCKISPYPTHSCRVRGLAFTPDYSQLVIGSEANGISLLNVGENAQAIPPTMLSSNASTMCVTRTDEKVLIGLERQCLLTYEKGRAPSQYLPRQLLKENTVYAYLKDSHDNEWVGMGYALYKRRATQTDFERVDQTGSNWIFALYEASDGCVWIGTMGSGLYNYNPKDNTYKWYNYEEGRDSQHTLRSNSINSIMEDSKGRIWISTDRGGLSLYEKETDSFKTFGLQEGLPDDIVYQLVEDDAGNLWFGTNKGLVCFNQQSERMTVFTKADGLPANEFTYNSAIRGKDSTCYFGTINGVVKFRPSNRECHLPDYPIFFTSLTFAEPREQAGNITYSEEIKIPYTHNTFSLTVGVPSAISLRGIKRFYYRLSPGENKWIPMESNRISFTNLQPSFYELEVKMERGEVVSTNKIKLIILHPWWSTPWAIAGYILIVIALVVIAFIGYRHQQLKKMAERQAAFESEKEKEVYWQKLNFFTEIAHEIRTPLSLIDLPLEAIEEKGLDHPASQHYLKVTRQNTARLLELTSQLLDFQKIEAGKLRLKTEALDIVQLVSTTIDRFEPSMSLKNKNMTRQLPKDGIITVTDKEAVTKIISNLLNNALKYALSKIEIRLETSHDSVFVRVISDGEKITDANKERIFETFYQTDKSQEQKNGVGIGLPLSRSLARLLGGELSLESNSQSDNIFVLSLPMKSTLASSTPPVIDEHTASTVIEEDSNQTPLEANGYHVLLVEDNEGIRSMLKERLSDSFLITVAANGKEALEILASKSIDVVVTDIMMPEMDGMELCKQIKENADLSPIPVVFITAKNDLESKVRGLQLGAEAYIEKPFSIKYLREMVVTLLENRRRSREAFSRKPFFQAENIPVNREEEKFMEKVLAIIKDNMSDENFNVEALGDKMCMSRSNLLRHIKAVFNLSPSELIRVVRLKAAAEMIRGGGLTLGEISQRIGISSQSYFTKLFFKQFNIMPNEFAKQVHNGNNT